MAALRIALGTLEAHGEGRTIQLLGLRCGCNRFDREPLLLNRYALSSAHFWLHKDIRRGSCASLLSCAWLLSLCAGYGWAPLLSFIENLTATLRSACCCY